MNKAPDLSKVKTYFLFPYKEAKSSSKIALCCIPGHCLWRKELQNIGCQDLHVQFCLVLQMGQTGAP